MIIDMIAKFFSFYIGKAFGRYQLRDIDNYVVNTVCRALPEPAASLLESHLFEMNAPFIDNQGTLVEFSFFNGVKYKESPSGSKLSFQSLSTPLGKVILSAEGRSNILLRADLYISKGYLFSIFYDKNPKDFFGKDDFVTGKVNEIEIDVLFDPMQSEVFCYEEHDHDIELPVWVNSLSLSNKTTLCSPPLMKHWLDRLIDFYDIEFPKDYIELAQATDHLKQLDAFEYFGPSQICTYMTPNEYVHVLVELAGAGVLCLLRNFDNNLYDFKGRDSELFYLDNESHVPVPVGTSLRRAIEKFMKEGRGEWIESEDEFTLTWKQSREQKKLLKKNKLA